MTTPLKRIEGPPWNPGTIVTLIIILTVPLLSLVVGGWTVAARPRDPNAWLVLLILTFPEIVWGNLQANFWPGFWHLLYSEWNRLIMLIWFPALACFGLFFPERSRIDSRLPWLKWLIFSLEIWCIAFYARLIYVLSFDISGHSATAGARTIHRRHRHFARGRLRPSVSCGCRGRAALGFHADARRRLRILTLGSCLSLGPALAIFIGFPLLGISTSGPYVIVLIPFMALFPLVISYVLVVQRAMDIPSCCAWAQGI